jgi:hypothetical protein
LRWKNLGSGATVKPLMRRVAFVLVLILTNSGHQECPETVEHAPTLALQDTLAITRSAIDQFSEATGRCPDSLEDLVPKYLRHVPVDPATGSSKAWVLKECEIRSGSPKANCDGILYSSL